MVVLLLPGVAALLVAGIAFLVQRARERKHRVIRAEAVATQARLHTSLSSAGVAVLAVGRDGRVLCVEGGLEVINAGRTTLVGRSAWDAFHDVPELTAALRAGLRGARGLERVRLGATSIDVHCAPRFDEAGRIIEVVAVVRDVTHEQVAADRAERLADVRSRILAVMGYRLRGQLSSVVGAAELARTGDATAQWLGEVEGAGTRLLTYVEHLVDFLELDAGRMQSHVTAFSLRDVLDRLEEKYRSRAQIDGTVLVVRAPRIPLDFEGDAAHLGQALDVILSVALGTNPGGQVVLNVDVHPRDTGVTGLVISVEDAGRGLSPVARRRVFEGFDSASAFWATRSGNSGLELPLAKRLVAMMGGTLEVDSEPGQGTTVRLGLDLQRAWLVHRPPVEAPAAFATARLLLVDDDDQQRRVHRALVEACGWTVIEARNGAEALDALTRGLPIDALLTELHMPVLDGAGLLRAVNERWPGLPCGVLTADARPESRRSGDALEVAVWAVKPLGGARMAEVLAGLRQDRGEHALPEATPEATSPLDASALQRLESLDAVEGPALAQQLTEAFVAAAPLQLLGLADALGTEGPGDTVDEIVASLTLSARLIGLPRLAEALAALEAGRAAGRTGRDLLHRVAHEVQAARDALADGMPWQAAATLEVAA
ncbi:MAG: response regulator [Dehalococcoidia bacterium]|nr:response regulator [Dehalococcoidia bacterium]